MGAHGFTVHPRSDAGTAPSRLAEPGSPLSCGQPTRRPRALHMVRCWGACCAANAAGAVFGRPSAVRGNILRRVEMEKARLALVQRRACDEGRGSQEFDVGQLIPRLMRSNCIATNAVDVTNPSVALTMLSARSMPGKGSTKKSACNAAPAWTSYCEKSRTPAASSCESTLQD